MLCLAWKCFPRVCGVEPGQLVDFIEFRVDPDFIREFITTTAKVPEAETPGEGTETNETAPEDKDTEAGSDAEEEGDQDALNAACTRKALEDAGRKTDTTPPETTSTEDKPMHPYTVPDRLIKGPHNNGLLMFAASGRPPKDYRLRLMRRALAESSEPTLTPNELMNRIRSRESRAGGSRSQWRLHIQTPTEHAGYPVVFFTTHPDKVVRINGVPVTARVYQRIIHWCTEIVKPIPGGEWEGDGYLEVEPVVYFDGVQVSLGEVPDLVRAHGAEDLLQPRPAVVIGDTAGMFEFFIFGQEAQDIRRVKAFIEQGVYLEDAEGEDPYDVYSGW